MAEPAAVLELPRRRSPAAAALVAMRPRQWTKNLLLFAGIIFAAKLGDPARWAAAVAAFVAYCAASSAAYLVNDVRDAESDRLHPVKRSRPIARGELSPRAACVLAGALALAAIAVAVRISEWLLLCTFLLALFVALGKRRAELGLDGVHARPALDGYSVVLVDQLLAIVAAATIAAYTGYALAAHDTRWLVATVPLVVYGLFRYLLLLHRRGLGEEPETLLVEDL